MNSTKRRLPVKPVLPKMRPPSTQATPEHHTFEDDGVYKALAYGGESLIGIDAETVDIEECTFDATRFPAGRLRRSIISDSEFRACDFASFRGEDVSLLRSQVSLSRLTGASWSQGQFRDVTFAGCRADSSFYRHSKFRAVVFVDCNLTQADFQNAELTGVRFDNCDLTGAQFANAKMTNVRFEKCTLIEVGGPQAFKNATVQGPGAMELALSLAREAGIEIEP